jgi:hypothetical protein
VNFRPFAIESGERSIQGKDFRFEAVNYRTDGSDFVVR